MLSMLLAIEIILVLWANS